ncbi:hypothetical protein N7457_003518 [Penicillium paradoxum]|uniref:uncharacterized protein n=1 Tax=Penicillium paradoxum TaxID=176176 RepID=UPI002548F7B5|nr:uncharacterized protein N7457_003518 [Penicillium paradoxum]KAJ5788528.1 hypothetical protein N7457_003518 [Penicillium paradoxum]
MRLGYVDQTLVGSGKFDKAAVFSAASDAVWAASPGFKVTLEEVQRLMHGYVDTIPLYAGGLHIGGENFQVIKANERSIYAKKGREGYCAVKTKTAIVLAHYPDTVDSDDAATIVEKLAAYLVSIEY